MKKFLAVVLVLLLAFSFASCEETGPSVFENFENAIDQTPASKLKITTKLVSALGELNSVVETTLNPDGSAKLVYSVENFNEDFTTEGTVVTRSGEVTIGKDGSYSDDGAFAGQLGATVAEVNIALDETKIENCKIEGDVLTGTVKAENTKAVLGTEIAADVYFMLTVSNNRVISITMNYELPAGAVTVVCSYN